jgi:uracil-DNA glycosylase family 4
MNLELSALRRQVETCTRCPLHKTRHKPVFGEGPLDSTVFFVGLGPGYHENLEGRPFVGAAGQLLNDLLMLSGLERDQVYITNIIKCYLPTNKATDEEVATCTPYLDKQLALIQPHFIIPLGNVAASYLLQKFGQPMAPMRDLHTKPFSISTLFCQLTIIPMYHPAAALRNPSLKRVVWEDWQKLGALI